MKKELTEKLWNDFPLLYKDKDADIRCSLIPFGFECGVGWYQIIYDLSSKLEKLIQEFIDKYSPLQCACCGDYPVDHVENGCNKIHSCKYVDEGRPTKCTCVGYKASYPRAIQVKEKFGTLRFYMSTSTDEMEDLIDKAEELSACTCEACGKEGHRTDYGWVRTLCDDCEKRLKEKGNWCY